MQYVGDGHQVINLCFNVVKGENDLSPQVGGSEQTRQT